jgi:hypothetical protein
MKHLITIALIATSTTVAAEGIEPIEDLKYVIDFDMMNGIDNRSNWVKARECIIENADGAATGAAVGGLWGAGVAMTGTQVGATSIGYGAGMSGPYLGMAAFSNPFTGFTMGLIATGAVAGAVVGATIDASVDGCKD